MLAKFPGSIYATLATNAGPKYRHISPRFSVGSSRKRNFPGLSWFADVDIKLFSIREYVKSRCDVSPRIRAGEQLWTRKRN